MNIDTVSCIEQRDLAADSPPFRLPSDLNSPSPSRYRPYSLIHISDPHLSRQYYREHLKSFKKLLRLIQLEGCDHLVISGDIVSTADPDDFFLARELFSHFSLLDSSKLTVVPGNHDIFGGPHRAVDILSFPQHIRAVDYHRNHALFREAFRETFHGVTFFDAKESYPFLKRVGPFMIIGLNSIPPWSVRSNILGTNGFLDDRQIEALQSLSESPLLRNAVPIIVLHHHFNDIVADGISDNSFWRLIESRTMRLRGRRRLLKVFKSLNVRYVLHGHIHRNEVYERSGILLSNGAGAVCDDPVRYLKYNRLTFDNGECRIATRLLPIPFEESVAPLRYVRSRTGLPLRSSQANGAVKSPSIQTLPQMS
jgi:3',5'-cyclic AMP phosphodiesterase CpdA